MIDIVEDFKPLDLNHNCDYLFWKPVYYVSQVLELTITTQRKVHSWDIQPMLYGQHLRMDVVDFRLSLDLEFRLKFLS